MTICSLILERKDLNGEKHCIKFNGKMSVVMLWINCGMKTKESKDD
jgi:hypothetical protein